MYLPTKRTTRLVHETTLVNTELMASPLNPSDGQSRHSRLPVDLIASIVSGSIAGAAIVCPSGRSCIKEGSSCMC